MDLPTLEASLKELTDWWVVARTSSSTRDIERLARAADQIDYLKARVAQLRSAQIEAQRRQAAEQARLAEMYAVAQGNEPEGARLAQEYADAQEPPPTLLGGPFAAPYDASKGPLCAPTFRCANGKVEDGGSGSNGRH